MWFPFFICSFVDRHLGDFHSCYCDVTMNMGVQISLPISTFLDIPPEAGFLGHMVIPGFYCLAARFFEAPYTGFRQWPVLFVVRLTSAGGSNFTHILPTISVFLFLLIINPTRQAVSAHYVLSCNFRRSAMREPWCRWGLLIFSRETPFQFPLPIFNRIVFCC